MSISSPHSAPPTGLWIHGASGRMGQEIQRLLATKAGAGLRWIGGSAAQFAGDPALVGQTVDLTRLAARWSQDDIGLTLDFSSDAGNALLLEALESLPPSGNVGPRCVLIGTTGLDPQRLERWRAVTKTLVLRTLVAPNTSIGILLTVRAALATAGVLSRLNYDIEVVETHHRHKKDAPSGTARFIADTLAAGVGGLEPIYQRTGVRHPGEIGLHAVRGGAVFGEHEIRLIGEDEEVSISHRAFSRGLFATGALVLGGWLLRQAPGFYGLLDIKLADLGVASDG